jgi:hypothetical protein
MKVSNSLAKRRAQEKLLQERQRFIKDEIHATAVAVWEHKTADRILKQDLATRVARMQQTDSEDIEKRRKKMRDLYEHERITWQQEIEKRNEIPFEQKMNDIRERAHRLKDRREKENEAFVRECYDRQWREGCDEIRTLNAKAMTEKLIHDRRQAVQMKGNCSEPNVSDVNEDNFMFYLERREKEDIVQRQSANEQVKKALDEQIRSNNQRIKTMEERQRDEACEQLKLWEQSELEEKMNKEEIMRQNRDRGLQIATDNKNRLEDKEKEQIEKLKEEKIILEYAQEKEKRQIEIELMQKQQNKGESRDYVDFLREQMVKEERDTSEIERIRSSEMEKIWNKRDEELKEREFNRKRISMEIKESREKQITDRRQKEEERKTIEALEVRRNISLWEKQQEQEKEEYERKRMLIREMMMWNKRSMEEKHQERMLERQQKHMIKEKMIRDEMEYQERIKCEAGKINTNYSRKTSFI